MPAVSDALSKTGAGKKVTRATQSTLVAMLERLKCSGNKQQVCYVLIVYSRQIETVTSGKNAQQCALFEDICVCQSVTQLNNGVHCPGKKGEAQGCARTGVCTNRRKCQRRPYAIQASSDANERGINCTSNWPNCRFVSRGLKVTTYLSKRKMMQSPLTFNTLGQGNIVISDQPAQSLSQTLR